MNFVYELNADTGKPIDDSAHLDASISARTSASIPQRRQLF